MARTAPVPNIPPIPGMCPSIAVMGGGAGGGGGSGDGAGDGDGNGPADGDGSGDAANGDESGAGNCGNGSNGDCTNCGHNVAAGDPVDIGTGRVYTAPAFDLKLPGPLPFAFRRKYSSHSRKRDVGLGPGWVHSLAWEIVVKRTQTQVWDGDGVRTDFPLVEQGEEVEHRHQRKLRREAEGFVLRDDSFERYFKPAPNDPTLFKLAHMRDRHGNTIAMEYSAMGVLARIIDCVGRVIQVGSDPKGHITHLAIHNAASQGQLIYAARYSYDEPGRLVRVTDAGNYGNDYGYDDRDRLTWHRLSGRPTFHFVYDALDRCFESWGAYDDRAMPGLAPDVPKLLADGVTPAKGILHIKIDYQKDYAELVDSLRVRRFFFDSNGKVTKGIAGGGVTSRKFDDNGNIVAHEDALGNVTLFQWDDHHRLKRTTNALGEYEDITRDHHGRPVAFHDGMGKILTLGYDLRGNIEFMEASLGDRASFRYNDRGMPVQKTRPDGGVIRIEYDAHQNPIRLQNPDGSEWKWQYDYRGRLLATTNPLGFVKRYDYDERDLLLAVYEPNGGTVRYVYDAARDCVSVSDALGTNRAEYNGAHKTTKLIHADGTFLELLYNREGFMVEMRNEKGERQLIEHDHMGLVRKIVGFDGGTEQYKLDAMGRLVQYTDQLGQKRKYERDALGRVVGVEFPDGSKSTLAFDMRGALIRAEHGATKLSYQVDAAGQVLREDQEMRGVTHSVEREYDVMRQPQATRSSLGLDAKYVRDNRGRMRELSLDPLHTFSFDYDALGQALAIELPGNLRLTNQWDPVGALARRTLSPAGNEAEQQPEWTGFSPRGATVDKTFNYSLNALLVSRNDLDFGAQEFIYDANDRVTERRLKGSPVEAFGHDASNNPYERGGGRSYGPGDRLQRKGNVDYEWDAAGRLTSRTVHGDGGAQKTRYEWDGGGHLARVRRPDGVVVEFTYDAFARRMEKRVLTAGRSGKLEQRASTRYVWNGPKLAHEIRKNAANEGNPIIEERTYVYDDRGAPLAHKIRRSDEPEVDRWAYYVNDIIGTPEHLVDATGKVIGTLERDVYGQVSNTGADTPLRFHGQYADDETGLYYNRYRYYDPETGRYISHDPAGGQPDPNLYRYCVNPIAGTDPLGLQHRATATFTPGNGGPPRDLGELDSTFDPATRDEMGRPGLTRPNADGTPRAYGEDECFSAFCRERFSDTEAKAIRRVNGSTTEEERDGSTLTIHGSRPPCFACRGRMEDFAERNNARVEYTWGPGEHGAGSFTSDHRVAASAAERGTHIVGMHPDTRSHWRPTASGRREP